WCAPCKKSFPAMQQLVENYKNDKTVAFYFINVNETKKDYKALSASYFKENQLDELVVLFDQKGERKRTNNVTFSKFASLFNSSGIPRKVVIKNGKIRFTSEGYSGNPDELKEEITTVIELLKTEN
ncbi:MAG: TlpA disulfide reductase family protein, partial [Flavobacteriaceae bacterium]